MLCCNNKSHGIQWLYIIKMGFPSLTLHPVQLAGEGEDGLCPWESLREQRDEGSVPTWGSVAPTAGDESLHRPLNFSLLDSFPLPLTPHQPEQVT